MMMLLCPRSSRRKLPWRRTAPKMAGFLRTMTGREGEKDKRYIQPRPPECSQSAAAVRRDRRHRSSRSSTETPLKSSAEIAWTNSGLKSNRSSQGSGSHRHKARRAAPQRTPSGEGTAKSSARQDFQHALRQETHTNIFFSIAFKNDPFEAVRVTGGENASCYARTTVPPSSSSAVPSRQ
jgi:hypothetical protein